MRPIQLNEVWLSPAEVVAGLARLFRRPAPPHALLLVGEEGVGKRTLAYAFAAAWMCLNRTPAGHCGACAACLRWSDEGQHPDLRVLRPDPDQIKIDSVRETRQWMQFAPTVAPFRFVILDEAHKLNPAAANALLKMLEEPPDGYAFLLTATATDLLLPTIRSRCRIIRLAPMPTELLAARLQARCGLESEQAQRLASLAEGVPGRALRWAETLIAEQPTERPAARRSANELQVIQELYQLLEQLGTARLQSALHLAERFREICRQLEASVPDRSTRSALATGLDYLLRWYREQLAEQRVGTQHIAQIIEARRAILRNANPQLITETLFLQLLGSEESTQG
jgi:DNA polymerase-3 subunit delta'